MMMPETRAPPPLPSRQGSVGGRGILASGKNIDVGGVRPLVSRAEIQCGRLSNTTSRSTTGKPAYKSQEEQYQEIQELRHGLGRLREENSNLKTRSRRLEEDLVRRDRQIQQLMDPSKNDEARRKLTDKGASLVSSLKLRVSRLEAALKDKEAELAKLHASVKATALNEMKIEAETYYQEVVRLRNQLNIMQQQQQQQQYHPNHQPPPPPSHHNNQHQQQQQQQSVAQHLHPPPPLGPNNTNTSNLQWSNMRGGRRGDTREAPQDRRAVGDGQESPTTSLRHALCHLEEENTRLGQQVSALTSEKEKLATDLERVLGLTEEVKGSYEGLSRAELIREVERREAEVGRLEAQHKQLSEAVGRRSEMVGENSVLLQARVAELQGREEEWNRERCSLQELISTLKDDRIFYKETAQKKDCELEGLRQEIQTLQQEVMGLQETQRKRTDRPTGPSQRVAPRTTRLGAASASQSGSSSDATTSPGRRTRPSSARPPAPGTRPQRSSKASSEPRDIATPPSRTQRPAPQQAPRKPPLTKSPTKASSSSMSSPLRSSPTRSSPTRSSPSGPQAGRRQSGASPGSKGPPKQPPGGRTSSSSISSRTSTPSASPGKSPAKQSPMPPQRKSSLASPQHRSTAGSASPQHRSTAGSASPQHRSTAGSVSSHHRTSAPASPAKTLTPRSSSRSSTPLSSAKSSPLKTTPRSPSKVPQLSPRRRGAGDGGNPPQASPHTPRRQGSSVLSSTEEDERVLAEIIFQRDTDSSCGEAAEPAPPTLARQRTMTLSTQDEEEEGVARERGDSATSLRHQSTRGSDREEEEVLVGGVREEVMGEVSPRKKASVHSESSITSPRDREIAENLVILRSLLTSHLNRQREVNHLLTQAPLLVGEGQSDSEAQESPRGRGRGRKSSREAPEGEEGSRGGQRSHSLVRQGTFNVYEGEGQGEAATLHATLEAHLTRVHRVKQFK